MSTGRKNGLVAESVLSLLVAHNRRFPRFDPGGQYKAISAWV